DPTAWFDPLYTWAARDADRIPWASLFPNPNLTAWLDAHHVNGAGRSALIVGCGLGDDAEELAQRGFAVTAFDVASTAIRWCRERFPKSAASYVVADLLDPPKPWREAFDFVFEAYTVQALPHSVREQALLDVAGFVRSGGELLLICRGRDEQDDPGNLPWPLTREELAT